MTVRTLTAGATNWKAGGTSLSYSYDWLVESADLDIHWSFIEESAGGFAWEHRLRSISEIEQSVPLAGGLASALTVRIEINETGAGQSLRNIWDTYAQLDGADLSVALLPSGEAYADRIKIFTGTIDGVSWIAGTQPGQGIGVLIASDKTLHINPRLPTTVINANDFPTAPDSVIGRALPLVYGRVLHGTTDTTPAPLIPTDETLTVFRMAGHAVYNDGTGWIGGVVGNANTQLITRVFGSGFSPVNASATLSTPITEYQFLPATASLSISRESGVTSSANAIDASDTTIATIATSGTDTRGNGYGYLGVKVSQSAIAGSGTVVVTIGYHKRKTGGASTTKMRFSVRIINATTNAVTREPLFVSPEYRHQSGYEDHTIRVDRVEVPSDSALEIFIEAINEGGVGGANDAWEVGDVDVTPYQQPLSEFTPFFLSGWNGYKDNASGDITGTPDQYIDIAADVIRSILVNHLGLSVDTTSFNAARTSLDDALGADYHLAFGIGSHGWFHERLEANTLLDDLALQSTCYVYADGDGTYKITPYDRTPSSQYDFTLPEILNLRVEMSQPQVISNSVEVNFGWRPDQNRFAQRSYVTPDGNNLYSLGTLAADAQDRCNDSFARYGDRRHIVVDAYGLRSAAEADWLASHLIFYFWTQLVTVEFETVFVGIHLEVTDFITITHPELTANENGQLFEIVRITHVPEIPDSRPAPIRIKAVRRNRIEFTYFCLKDQGGTTWCYYINNANELDVSSGTPSIVTRFATDVTPGTIPYWLEIDNPTPTTRYVHPLLTGELYVATGAPAIGTGYVGSPTWRGVSWPLTDWQIDLNALDEIFLLTV